MPIFVINTRAICPNDGHPDIFAREVQRAPTYFVTDGLWQFILLNQLQRSADTQVREILKTQELRVVRSEFWDLRPKLADEAISKSKWPLRG